MTCHRFLFALLPPPRERARIAALRDGEHGSEIGGENGGEKGGKDGGPAMLRNPVADDRLHLTLWISADHPRCPDALVERLLAAAALVDAPPAPVRLDRLTASDRSLALRPSRRPAALAAVHRRLCRLAPAAALRPGWTFSPHVTLGYRDATPFSRAIGPLGWEADEFVLIHSLVGETRHIPLGRWPLATRQGELF